VNAHELRGPGGTITITPAALTSVVVQAAELVDGARVRRPRRGLEIAIENGRVRVALELAAQLGVVLPELAREVQERVAGALEGMCGLVVDSVDVSVDELDGR
jgi:uncharacterized alkaline shock family protein YloU